MAEIGFERRGRPLWVVVLILLVIAIVAYYAWVSYATLREHRTLEPSTTPATSPAAAPGAGPGAATPLPRP